LILIRVKPLRNPAPWRQRIGETLKNGSEACNHCDERRGYYASPFVALDISILLIEENDADASVLRDTLVQQGVSSSVMRLTCPSDGKTHLGTAAQSRDAGHPLPSAVILGIGLEARVAFDFIRWIRRHPELNSLVVIALGELGHLREVQDAYASGANAYFVKGPDCGALLRTLQSAFRHEPGGGQIRDTHPAFRDSTDLYQARHAAQNSSMAIPAPLLLVDDDDAHTKQFALGLENLRVHNPLRRVSGADEAIDYLEGAGKFSNREENPFPIILFLDIHLADSHRLLAWLEGHPTARPAGIVALTSSHDMRPVIQAYHLGVHSFLKEPPKLEEFRDALAAVATTELRPENGGYLIYPRRSAA
jgi:CheY-like chemotaxis protein